MQKSLLIIEDNAADADHYFRLLEEFDHGFEYIEHVHSIGEAKKIFAELMPDCCLLDNFLPDGSAEDFLNYLALNSGDSCVNNSAIIVLTGLDDSKTAVNLMQKGAQDYLIKQYLDSVLLQKSIRNALRTSKLQAQLSYLALYDALTGLVNRSLFMDRLTQIFEEGKRYQRQFALFYVDLNDFKGVNDLYGHAAGDEVLKQVAERMKANLRSSDTAARIGGDEFMILLPDICEAKAHHVAFKFVSALNFDVLWNNQAIHTSATVGLTVWPSNSAETCEALIHEADTALYRAKKQLSRFKMAAFHESGSSSEQDAIVLAQSLPSAIANSQLQIAWQPVVNMLNSRVTSVEALIRWNYNGNWVAPERIIETVLNNRMSQPFHAWLFKQVLSQFKQWQMKDPSLKVALNFPANMCHDKRLIEMLVECVKYNELPPQSIIIEVTESHMIRYPKETREQLSLLADYGMEISIDDFGTGFSSLQYLATLPCNSLKVDRSFFCGLADNPKNLQIIDAIAALAHRLNMKVVAEGIETEFLYRSAKNMGCDFAQGYLFSKPKIIENGGSLMENFPYCQPSSELNVKLQCAK